jgi:DNA excision repair protein ERCC-2
MKEILFPYKELRKGQDDFITKINENLKVKKNVLAHVPTGVGKTISALGPCLKYAIEHKKTVFFVTSRNTQHKIAIQTLKDIKEKFGLNFSVVDLIGKRGMCLVPGIDQISSFEFAEYCRDVKDSDSCLYYINLKKEKAKKAYVIDKIKRDGPMQVEEVIKECGDYKLCPYEISCEVGKEAKVIVGDYYHILANYIRDNLFERLEKEDSDIILVIDEAHNLPDRARDLLSVNITSFIIDQAIREAREFKAAEGVIEALETIEVIVSKINKRRSLTEEEIKVKKEEFYLDNYEEIVDMLEDLADDIRKEKKRSYIGSVANFLVKWQGTDKGFLRLLRRTSYKGKEGCSLEYNCLDPSVLTKHLFEDFHSVIGMSGTLRPLEMYRDLLGIDAELLEYSTPFSEDNVLRMVIPETTTKFTSRDLGMYKQIAAKVSELTDVIKGNVAIFFPSYYIMNEIKPYIICKKTMFVEDSDLTKGEKEEMIEKFKKYKDTGAVILGVSSGSFGEGIDLPGELLNGVVIVGLPLGRPDLQTKELIEYYDKKYGKGWDYGYLYPAFIKCLQNAGRCIRSHEDRGVIVFLDERYAWDNYRRLFPKDMKVITTKLYADRIKNFFS